MGAGASFLFSSPFLYLGISVLDDGVKILISSFLLILLITLQRNVMNIETSVHSLFFEFEIASLCLLA